MPHGDRAALDSFFGELRRVWIVAGSPSYKEFEKLSARVKGPAEADGPWLSRSTTQEILAGRRQQPPKWRWVARFITVLRVAAGQVGVDPGLIGTLAEWKQKHEAVCVAMVGGRAREPARSDGRPAGIVLGEQDAHRDHALAALLGAVGRDWWHGYRDLVPDSQGAYLSLEPAASLIRTYDAMLVPALLQTEEYADAAIRASWPTRDQATVARLTQLRMRRQGPLHGSDAPRLWVIIEETAARRRLGSAKTMRTQIRHLIEMSQRPNVTVQVIPLDTSVHAVAGGPITLLRFPRSDLPDVVYLEQLNGTICLPYHGLVNHYKKVMSRLGIEALSPAATTDFLRDTLMEI